MFFTTCALTFAQDEAITKDGQKVLLYNDGSWKFAGGDPLDNSKMITVGKLEIPKIERNETIISHIGYSLSYNETHEQAKWVAYELTSEETNRKWERTNKFLIDAKVKTGTANDKDYYHSGYDKGHLAPASDMGWSSAAMAESFYYSNISPQDSGFNRGIWKRLEGLVRTWAVDNESVYIVTGPVLTTAHDAIGKNKISVPKYFYKVILDHKEPGIKGIGFIMPHMKSSGSLQIYAVSIDSVEKFTGIDFFPLLPDEQENFIESSLSIESWSWKSSKLASGTAGKTVSAQCDGITGAGARCKNKTLNVNGYCSHHVSQINNRNESIKTTQRTAITSKNSSFSIQCSGTTKAGNRCKRVTTSSNGRCYQHGEKS